MKAADRTNIFWYMIKHVLRVVILPTSQSYLYSHLQRYDVNAEAEGAGGL